MDTLIAPLPPPTSINPFGVTPMTIPTTQSTNPFEANKPPAPTLAELQQGNTFGKFFTIHACIVDMRSSGVFRYVYILLTQVT